MTHAWCSDTERDEAVRAAEDKRTGPLPTLEEAIARPFAEAAERSPAVSEMGGTQSGIRTERVTLECVHRFGKPPREWDWWRLMELRPGESVRVVEESARTSTAGEGSCAAPAASEWRDLDPEVGDVVEEGDEICWWNIWKPVNRGEIGIKVCQHGFSFRRRVPTPAASGNSQAILDSSQAASGGGEQSNQPLADGGRPREEPAESATADSSPSLSRDTPVVPADGADPTASGGGEGDVSKIAGLAFDSGFGASREGFNGECAFDHLAPEKSTFEGEPGTAYEKLRNDSVAAILSSTASNGGGLKPHAWGVVLELHDAASAFRGWAGNVHQVRLDKAIAAAERLLTQPRPAVPASGGGEQPRGWLTEEERDFLDHHRRECAERASTFSNARAVPWVRRVKLIDALLDRSSPPEVKLPVLFARSNLGDRLLVETQVRQALAAAGVAVKEVRQ